MNSSFLVAVTAHLWQSTLFALAAACLTLALRRNSARIRWFVWLAASVKFLVPFAFLTAVGAQFPWPSAPLHLAPGLLATAAQTAARVGHISADPVLALAQTSQGAAYRGLLLIILEIVWALGALFAGARWFRRWLVLRRVLQESKVTPLTFDIPVRSAASHLEPAVVGVLRPVLLLPQGLEQHLTPEELQAVLAHERCHVAWRDNLAATIHMLVELLFWFHPLVWWLGKRMVDERERACDERVLAEGHAPGRYAEGILKVCEHYLQSPLCSAAGVGGGILNRRIAVILKNRLIERLGVIQRVVLTLAACTTLALPLAIGSLSMPYGAAAATVDAGAPVLRNVVIKLGPPPFAPGLPHSDLVWVGLMGEKGADVQLAYTSLRGFVATAYGVHGSQVVGKDLSKEPHYSITADNPWNEKPTDSGEQRKSRFWEFNNGFPAIERNLLATRFGLVAKRERRQMDGYVLTVDPSGSKLHPDTTASFVEQGIGQSDRELIATMAPVSTIVRMIEDMFDAPVVDGTGLEGTYDYKLTWSPPPLGGTPSPATMAAALEELGLHLEAKPVTVDVINVVGLKSPEQVLASK